LNLFSIPLPDLWYLASKVVSEWMPTTCRVLRRRTTGGGVRIMLWACPDAATRVRTGLSAASPRPNSFGLPGFTLQSLTRGVCVALGRNKTLSEPDKTDLYMAQKQTTNPGKVAYPNKRVAENSQYLGTLPKWPLVKKCFEQSADR